MITLYDYFRSSASFRVRIALNLKSVKHELKEVHLVHDGGQQHSDAYKALNSQELVPTLVDGDMTLTQSMAILEYIEEQYPKPSLLPGDLVQKSKIRSMAQLIACDVHPLNNLRILKYLKLKLKVEDEDKSRWYQHWVTLGFTSVEAMLGEVSRQSRYCFGDQVSMADLCLIPQVYNAYRFKCNMDVFPKIAEIYQNCMKHEAFVKAAPNDWSELCSP